VDPDGRDVVPIAEYPPSLLDETCIDLPNANGIAWNRKRESWMALHWWIIWYMPSVQAGKRWAEKKLDDRECIEVLQEGKGLWCTIYRQWNGTVCVEYKGRKLIVN
jgi:hypothetical protein